MDVKCRWCQTCEKEKMETTVPHHLEELLPEEHCHCVCSYVPLEHGFTAAVKLHISTREQAEKWLEDFQQSSKVTLRVAKTFPAEDRVRRNSYRVDMRCQHNTRQTGHTKKNTNCPAGLYLVLKKQSFSKNRKSRSTDVHIQEGLLLHVTIKHHHNHRLDCAEFLRQRDVSLKTVEKLKTLFQSGHSPSSALKTLKYDLQEEHGDAYVHASADRSICPDVNFCYRLYYSIYKKDYLETSGDAMKVNLQEVLDMYNRDQGETCVQMESTADGQALITLCTPVMKGIHSEELLFMDLSGDQEEAAEGCAAGSPPAPVGGSTPQDVSGDASALEGRLRAVFDGLVEKLRKDNTFRAPIESFVGSYERMGADGGLVSALSAFGKTKRGTSDGQMQRGKALHMSARIGAQPTVIFCSKTPLGRRRALIAGRPLKKGPEKDHSYGLVTEGSPTGRAPQCVSDAQK